MTNLLKPVGETQQERGQSDERMHLRRCGLKQQHRSGHNVCRKTEITGSEHLAPAEPHGWQRSGGQRGAPLKPADDEEQVGSINVRRGPPR